MKTTVVCLIVMVACSCRQVEDGRSSEGGTMDRSTEIEKIVKEHFEDYRDYEFEILGGLTISQVKRDLIEGHVGKTGATKDRASAELSLSDDPDWQEFVSKCKQGGDVYYFKSDRRSWTELRGIEGYVLIHKDKITGVFVTGIN